ncbi:OmpA family protein [Methylocystis sp. ATCC 49242]|uniref:OmpA family protein n=1 Tax=Methylocystis sp. ATCC 49242 TaxID=622637 RepID=UPI001FCBFBC8|nr:OmpA family protein [Methylocystis sp. ATCC 49242]
MTDMTVSFLFIVMILLAFFASQFRDPDKVSRKEYESIVRERDKLEKEVRELREQLKRLANRPVETYLAAVANQRERILKDLQSKLKADFPDLQVVISEEMDALRFKGDGLFKTGSSELRPDKRRIVESIATRLGEVLPCYTLGPRSSWNSRCNAAGAVIEAVLVEGHTDSDGQDNSNITLSTNRANETFFAMTKHEPALVDFRNDRAQPVLSVAGYGRMRPVADNATQEGKATNRRIDLRIIMFTPGTLEEISKVQNDLRSGVTGAGSR